MSGTTKTPRGVIRSYYAISGLYSLSASLIWGVNTLFLLDAGLDILEVFIANAVFTGAMALFEIPTGVVADAQGRRVSFLLSVVVVLLGTLGYVGAAWWDGGLFWFCFWSVVLGLGYTFYSGAVEAWLVDALKATGFRGQVDRVFARGSIVFSAAMLIGTIGGGLLGTLDLALPFVVRAGMLAAIFGVAFFTMHDLGFTPRALGVASVPAEMIRIASESVQFGWKRRSVRLLIVAAATQAIFRAWGFHAWQPYFLDLLDYNAAWVAGAIAAAVALSVIIGNTFVDYITRFCGKRTTLMVGALCVQALGTLGVGLATNFWVAVGLYLLVMTATGVQDPVRQAYLHDVIPSKQRATVISFAGLVSSGGSMMGQGTLGYIARARSIAAGYVVGSVVTALAIPSILLLRRMAERYDNIIGRDAGKQSPCAAQGLPEVAHVDSIPRVATEDDADQN